MFPTLDNDEPRFSEGRRALETARRVRGLACQPFSRRPAATAPPPPDDSGDDDDQSEMDAWRATRPANDLADNGIHAFGDHHSPGGVDVTWEVAAAINEGTDKGGTKKAESGSDTDSDREILPFDHDYDTEAEMEGRRCLLYTSPSPRDQRGSRMPSSA